MTLVSLKKKKIHVLIGIRANDINVHFIYEGNTNSKKTHKNKCSHFNCDRNKNAN